MGSHRLRIPCGNSFDERKEPGIEHTGDKVLAIFHSPASRRDSLCLEPFEWTRAEIEFVSGLLVGGVAQEMSVVYPFAIDNDYAIWRAFNNEYWPALYFADAQGRMQHHQFGEGEYELPEMIIQHLLAEAGIGGISRELASVHARRAETAADWEVLKSPE